MFRIAALLAVLSGSVAQAQTMLEVDEIATLLIVHYDKYNSRCRGGDPTDEDTWKACGARDYQLSLIGFFGWCHGKQHQANGEFMWHRCGPNSNYPDLPGYFSE